MIQIKKAAGWFALLLLMTLSSACRRDNTNPAEFMRAFLDEFYLGRAQADLTTVLDKYTEWPDFVVGQAVQVAVDRDIRLVVENGEQAEFEVRFKVAAEESEGKVVPAESEVTQIYRLRRRRGGWKILEPVQMPCISVAGETARLEQRIKDATERIAKNDFAEGTSREYFEALISNARASIELLGKYR